MKKFNDFDYIERKAKHAEKINREKRKEMRDKRLHIVDEDEQETISLLDSRSLYKLKHYRNEDD